MRQYLVKPWDVRIKCMRTKYFQRLAGMEEQRWEKLSLQWEPTKVTNYSQDYVAHRLAGRPILRWIDHMWYVIWSFIRAGWLIVWGIRHPTSDDRLLTDTIQLNPTSKWDQWWLDANKKIFTWAEVSSWSASEYMFIFAWIRCVCMYDLSII